MFCFDGLQVVELTNITECNECLEAVQQILVPIEDFFVKCKFRNQVINCTKSFKQTVVNDKICYTFNELGFYRHYDGANTHLDEAIDDWSIDEGYKPTAPIDAYPYRALEVGFKFGFSILLRTSKKHYDFICSDDDNFLVNDFKIPFYASSYKMSPQLVGISSARRITTVFNKTIAHTNEKVGQFDPIT